MRERNAGGPHSGPRAVSNRPLRTGRGTSMDHRIAAIAVGVALLVVIVYALVMRVFYRDSKELDRKIDYSKMKEWKDED